jgi:hypothetical protein
MTSQKAREWLRHPPNLDMMFLNQSTIDLGCSRLDYSRFWSINPGSRHQNWSRNSVTIDLKVAILEKSKKSIQIMDWRSDRVKLRGRQFTSQFNLNGWTKSKTSKSLLYVCIINEKSPEITVKVVSKPYRTNSSEALWISVILLLNLGGETVTMALNDDKQVQKQLFTYTYAQHKY